MSVARYLCLAFILIPSPRPEAVASSQEHDGDNPQQKYVQLPELRAYKLKQDAGVILRSRVDEHLASFIRDLRRIPLVRPSGTPTSLILDKYLHRKSRAIDTDCCYIESDWMTDEDLAVLASVSKGTALATLALFGTSEIQKIREVVVSKKDDYLALVDAWAASPALKNAARRFESTFIEDYRCGSRTTVTNALPLVVADSVSRNVPESFYEQEPLREGLHVYVASMVALQYETFVSPTVTTPSTRSSSAVDMLFETAKEYLSRPKRDRVEAILSTELNALTIEKLSVSFAFINYLLDGNQERWNLFHRKLEAVWSSDKRPSTSPERRKDALHAAIVDGLGIEPKDLDKQLQEYTEKNYYYLEELATMMGVDREAADSSFQGFVKICELKRQQKPVSEKGEKLYQEIVGRIQKKLQTTGEKF